METGNIALWTKKISGRIESRVKRLRAPAERARYDRKLQPLRDADMQIVHFLHVRKAGGSAVKNALLGVADAGVGNVHIEMHPHRFTLRDVPEGDRFFFFVRDPVSRFVSGFWSRQRKGRPKNNIPWNWDEAQAFAVFETPNQLALALSSDDPGLRKKAEKAMKGIRHVNSSCNDWIVSPQYFLSRLPDLLMVGRMERLGDEFERLKSLLGIEDGVGLPDDSVKSHRSPDGLDKHLNKQAEINLRAWYQADYEFIRLCEEKGLVEPL